MKDQKPKPPPKGPRLVGYARVSTDDQNLDMQVTALINAGVHQDNIWKEHVSGVAKNRPELEKALADARRGDTFIVWKLDRLGRSLADLINRVKEFHKNGVTFKSITESIDTSTAIGSLLLGVLGAVAQFERDLTVERTRAGMKAHRERGGKIGQPAKVVGAKKARADKMFEQGKTVVQVAAALGVAPGTVYNAYESVEEIHRLQAKAK